MQLQVLLPLTMAVALILSACGEAKAPAESGATCPKDSTLTYDNFAKDFFEKYCVECHSSELSGSMRQGAPLNHDFNTLALIRAVPADHIDEQAAAGPDAVNDFMPEEGPAPTLEEREKLGEWLACDRP
jgi:cytochrome c5